MPRHVKRSQMPTNTTSHVIVFTCLQACTEKKTVIIRKEGISIYHIEEQNSIGAPAPNLSKVIHTTFTLTLYRIRRRWDRRNTTGNPTRQRPPRQPLDDEILLKDRYRIGYQLLVEARCPSPCLYLGVDSPRQMACGR